VAESPTLQRSAVDTAPPTVVQFHDPRGLPAVAATPYELRHPLGPATSIALMANGFPDSVTFLNHVATALSDLIDDATFQLFDKGNASTLASEEMLGSATSCDVVVAAYGH